MNTENFSEKIREKIIKPLFYISEITLFSVYNNYKIIIKNGKTNDIIKICFNEKNTKPEKIILEKDEKINKTYNVNSDEEALKIIEHLSDEILSKIILDKI